MSVDTHLNRLRPAWQLVAASGVGRRQNSIVFEFAQKMLYLQQMESVMETKKPQRLEVPRVLDRETENKVNFMSFIIQKFARAFKMGGPEAYLYLKKYGGLDFLDRHWWALHTDNPIYAIDDLFVVCRKNGGLR